MYNIWVFVQRRKIKTIFTLCTEKISSLKTTLFLALKIVQTRPKRPTCHTFLPIETPANKEGKPHGLQIHQTAPKRENNNKNKNTNIHRQCRNIYSDANLYRHKFLFYQKQKVRFLIGKKKENIFVFIRNKQFFSLTVLILHIFITLWKSECVRENLLCMCCPYKEKVIHQKIYQSNF